MITKIFAFLFILSGLLLQNTLSCQIVYFNKTIDLIGEWGGGMTVIASDSTYHIAAITGPGKMISIVEVDKTGEEGWIKKFGNPQEYWYPGNPGSFKKFNSGFILGGANETIDSVFGLFIKFDHYIDTIITRQYSNPDDDYLVVTNSEICYDGGLIFTGDISRITGSPDLLILKTDSLGNEIWRTTKNYGNYERGWSIIQTQDSGYIVGGYRYVPGIYHSGDPLIVKFDKDGNFKWGRNPGYLYEDDKAMVCLNTDSSFTVLTAIADSIYINDFDYTRICVKKYSQDGVELWSKKYGESIGGNFVFNIKSLPDGGYICCGEQNIPGNYDVSCSGWLLRLNTDGDSLWFRRYTYSEENPYYYNGLRDVSLCQDGGFIATGEVWDYPPNALQKIWALKVDSLGCEFAGCDTTVSIEEHGGMEAGKQGGIEIFPNPASGIVDCRWSMVDGRYNMDLTLEIYDIFGRTAPANALPRVGEGWGGGTGGWTVDVSSLPPGIYLAVVREGTRIVGSGKFLVVR